MTQQQSNKILVEGRLVGGHPMVRRAVTDDQDKPKMQGDGTTPRTSCFVAIAIPKGAETDFKQTVWGQVMLQAAQAGWPNGEFNAPTFKWKVDDGDSQIPNQRGKKPCDREGYPGHWVIKASTELYCKCFHVGQYDPHQQIQDSNEIKPGDYCAVYLDIKANNPAKSPGIYVNPMMFELSRAGQHIILDDGPDAADVFNRNGAPAAQPAPAAAPNPAAPTAPAHDFLNPAPVAAPAPAPAAPPAKPDRVFNGQTYAHAFLLESGWAEEQIQAQTTPAQ